MPSMADQQLKDSMLMLRRPTIADKLRDEIPYPTGGVPKNGLPCWNTLPLGNKLPIIDYPKEAFVLYRDKLGKKLWRPSPVQNFRLDDPYCHEVQYHYENVHDPDLAWLHRRPEMKNLLQKRGFVTANMEPVCTLRQFNTYRRYLQSLYREQVVEEYQRRDADLRDAMTLKIARSCEERQLDNLRRRQEREESMNAVRADLDTRRKDKERQMNERRIRWWKLINQVEENREVQRLELVERGKLRDERVKYRNAVAADIERAKVIATIQMWNREEHERKARQERQQKTLQEYKEKQLVDRWNSKIQAQLEREEREKGLLQQQEEMSRLTIDLWQKKMESEELRMQASLKQIQEKRAKSRTKRMDVKKSKSKQQRRPTKKPSVTRMRRQTSSLQDDDTAKIEIRRAMTRQVSSSIQTAKASKEKNADINDLWRIFRDSGGIDPPPPRNGVPDAVAHVVDHVLESMCWEAVHRKVMVTLKIVYHRALDHCRALINELPAKEQQRWGWVCSHSSLGSSSPPAKHYRSRKAGSNSPAIRRASPRASPQPNTPRSGSGSLSSAESNTDHAEHSDQRPGKKTSNKNNGRDTERRQLEQEIQAVEMRNERLKKALERASSADDTDSKDSGSHEFDVDANFRVMARQLRRKIVYLASQSLSEMHKMQTQHRWKVLKEVELSELVRRLCTMMLTLTPRDFLVSQEFQWAADILARDVMKEVRAQMRREKRARDAEIRAERQRERDRARTIQLTQHKQASQQAEPEEEEGEGERPADSPEEAAEAAVPVEETKTEPEASGGAADVGVGEAVDADLMLPVEPAPSETPTVPNASQFSLLRLHRRSAHQPSIPSLDSMD